MAAALVAVMLPQLAGVPWAGIAGALAAVPWFGIVLVVVLWIAGLAAHTVTLTAALPSLTHRRALTLNLTGSAVANVLPMGGVAGVALNRRMTRSWGVSGEDFAGFTVVSNVWDVLAKVVLAALVLPVVVVTGTVALGHVLPVAAGVAGVAAGVLLALVAAMVSHRAAEAIGAVAESATHWLLALVRSGRRPAVRAQLVEVQAQCQRVVRAGWGRLSLGMTLYTALLLALLWACLHLTGAGVPLAVVLLALTVERVLTLAGLTPGGLGVVEVGLTAVLLAAGASPVGAVSGVLLYRALTFGLEIPVGGTNLALWWWLQRRAARRAARHTDGQGQPSWAAVA